MCYLLTTATRHITGKYKKTHLHVLINLPGYIAVRCRREADAIGELNLQSKKKKAVGNYFFVHMIQVAYGNVC